MADEKKKRGPSSRGHLNIKFDDDRKEAFLDILAATGTPAKASQQIGVSVSTVQAHKCPTHRLFDPDFKEGYEMAMSLYRETLATEVHRRAVDGVVEPVFYKGRVAKDPETDEPTGIRKFSDRLLELQIKRHDPAYRDRQTVENIDVTSNAALEDLKDLSPESRAKLREILEKENEPDGESPPDMS